MTFEEATEPNTEGRKLDVEEKKLPPHLVRNAGVFYVCHRLSRMGSNALARMCYAKGPNVVIGSEDEERTWRLKVRSLSKRDPVPLGKDPRIDYRPHSRGGTDAPDNLQALCYSCNSMKRERDATDFHELKQSYE